MNQEQLRLLCEAGHTAPSADNSQPWHFIIEANKIKITYDSARVLGSTFPPTSLATYISLGAVIEAIVAACEEQGIAYALNTDVSSSLGLTQYACFTFDDTVSENFTLKNSRLYLRHTNRFAYKTDQVDTAKVNALIDDTLIKSTTKINWTDSKATISEVTKLIKSASEIRFQTPEVHEWLMKSLRFDQRLEHEDGLHISTLDLPPMGSSFMRFIAPWRRTNTLNKLGMYRLMASIEAQPIAKAPGIMAIICSNNVEVQLQAGRDLFTIWLGLNKLGLAVHPYFVITDQITRLHDDVVPNHLVAQASALEEQTRKTFNLTEDESLCMLFRVGYPQKQAIRSKRLNLTDVVTIED